MKKLFQLIVLLGLTTNLMSQIPNGFSYQAVVRNNDKALITNQTVSIKASIIRNEEEFFTQTQTATTNENGLLTIIIGNEDFQTIDWTDGPLFIKTQIDPLGGDNYTIENETQLLSVPYAMAAQTAVTVPDLDLLIERVNKLEEEVEELRDRVEELSKIPFEEFSLENTSCQWINLENPLQPNEVVIINSYEKFEDYTTCAEGDYIDFDFLKHSLILARGYSKLDIIEISNKTINKVSNNEYKLDIVIHSNYTITIETWNIALITDKINDESSIKLNVSYSFDFETDFIYLETGEKEYLKVRKDKVVILCTSEEEANALCEDEIFISADIHSFIWVLGTIDSLQVTLEDLELKPGIVSATYGLEYYTTALHFPTNKITVKFKEGLSPEEVINAVGLTESIIFMELSNPNSELYKITLNVPLGNILQICRNLFESGLCKVAQPSFIMILHHPFNNN